MEDEKGAGDTMPPPYMFPTSEDNKAMPAGYPPQTGYPPAGYPPQTYPQPGQPGQSYPQQPYPPQAMSQQATSNNVVVVGQPAVASTVRVELPPKASDFLIFSVVLMVLCFIHGNIPFVLLTIPALICSIVAHDYNNGGNYDSAKQCGHMALGCNIAVIVSYVIVIIIIIITVAVIVSTAAAAVASVANVASGTSVVSSNACTYSYTCGYFGTSRYTCSYRCT